MGSDNEVFLVAEFTRSLGLERNWETLVRRGLSRIVEVVSGQAGALFLCDERQGTLRIVASQGFPLTTIRKKGFQRMAPGSPGIATQIVRERRGLTLSNLDQHPWASHVSAELAALGYNTCHAVPLLVLDQVVGVVEVFSSANDWPAPQALSLAGILTDVLALAMNNNRLVTERERRLQIQQTLFDLSQAVVSVLDAGDLLPKIVRNAVNLVGGSTGYIGTWDEAKNGIAIRAAFNGAKELSTGAVIPSDGLLGQVVAGGRALVCDDLAAAPEHEPLLAGLGVTSAVGVPLRDKNRVAGVLVVATNRPHVHLTWEDAGILEAFADLASIAMANARLFRQIRLKANQMSALLKISRRLTESLQLDYVLNSVLKEATFFVRADAGLIHLANKTASEFRPASAFGPVDELMDKLGVSLQQVILTAVTRGEPVRISNGQPGQGDQSQESPTPATGVGAVLSVPLLAGNRRIGALTCLSDSGQPFSDDDVTFLWTLASHATVAIENARLHEETAEMSIRDALTGLYNLRRFKPRLTEELLRAERYGHELAFLMIDIDNFKQWNDRYGHQMGDAVLRDVAAIVTAGMRSIDQAFRYGGEEICAILPETPKAQAALVAERIRAGVAGHRYQNDKGELLGRVTVSVGVASFPSDAHTEEDLVARADEALYRAKSSGRNRVAVCGRPELTIIR